MRESDVVFRDELEQLAAERGFELHIVVGDHATDEGRELLSPAHLRELVPDVAEREVYVCGPPAMIDAIERASRHADVPPRTSTSNASPSDRKDEHEDDSTS